MCLQRAESLYTWGLQRIDHKIDNSMGCEDADLSAFVHSVSLADLWITDSRYLSFLPVPTRVPGG